MAPRRSIFVEPELPDEPQEHVDREAVEVLGAENEVRREERPDLRIGNAGEQLGQLFRARRHGRILRGDVSTGTEDWRGDI